MTILEKQSIKLGYIPLLDCVAILWAKHRGFFDELGLDVTLVKETSWASLRDRLAFGVLDAAHCLSAMLPAATLGLDQIGVTLKTPLVLSINRAFISLNQKLCFESGFSAAYSATDNANKMVQLFQTHKHISLAHVFKHSIHYYCIKEWLSLANIDVAQNLQLSTCPPSYIIEAIQKQNIDGFCVGEPWNTQSQIQGYSNIIVDSKDVIPEVADKVLAITDKWAQDHPQTLMALCDAIIKAQHELNTLSSLSEVWKLLKDHEIIQFECSEDVHVEEYYKLSSIIQNLSHYNQPKASDFKWIIQQICKWDHLVLDEKNINKIANECIYINY